MWKCVPQSVRGIANRAVIGVTTAALVAATGSHFVMPEAKQLVSYEVMNVAAIDESPTTVGIADSGIYFTESLDAVKERLDLMESLGVSDVRLLIPWIFIQTQDPMGGPVDWDLDLDWGKLDQIVQEVDSRGMGILGVLQWSPDWATDGVTGMGHPADVQDFANFAAAIATRYGEKISAYEVWNEPNAALFWNPVDPVAYTRMLQATYNSLKAVNPEIIVVGAVVGATQSWGGLTMNPVDFVRAMYDAGADGFFDALSFHPYDFTTMFSEQDVVDWRELTPLFQVEKIRELMDQHLAPGEEQLKIWISEYGLPTSVVSAETQRAFLTDLINAWQSFSGAGPIFLYSIKDDLNAIGDERFFGIFDADGNFKGSQEAFEAFKELIDCLGGCSPTEPSNPVGSLLQFLQQVITQVLSFVPNMVAGVVSAVSNLISSILNGLSGIVGGSVASPGAVRASLRSAAATTDTDAATGNAPARDLESIEAGADVAPVAGAAIDEVAVVVDAATEEVPFEEVVSESPVEEVVIEEVADEVVTEVPVVDEVVEEGAVTEVPVAEEPVTEEPVAGENVVDGPVTGPATTDEGTDTFADTAGASEGSAPKLSDDSASNFAETREKSAEPKVTRSVPKASVSSGAPEQRAAGSGRDSASASSGRGE